MPSRPAAGVIWARCQIYGAGDNKEFSNVFWYSPNAGTMTIPDDVRAVGIAIYDHIRVALQPMLPDSVELRGAYTEASNGALAVGSDRYLSEPGSIVGGDPLPLDVALVVQKLSGFPGPKGRGRWYFGQLDESMSEGSYLSVAGETLADALVTACLDDITVMGTAGAFTLEPQLFSPTDGVLRSIIQTASVGLLGTRRRRRAAF